jgi:hypothetical protein
VAMKDEHHVCDYKRYYPVIHTRRESPVTEKGTIQGMAGTVGDQSSYRQRCRVAVNFMLVTIKFLSHDPHKEGIAGD